VDTNVAVSGLSIQFDDGKVIESIIEERRKIEAKYEDAIADGKTAMKSSYLRT
jgi:hypothetical protein